MHSAVLQNKKYIKFADENTVEVIAMGGMEEAARQNKPKAGTYTKKVNGEDVEFMVEFPNLTLEEMVALRKSKASSYNDTGKIPFTALINPHNEEEITRWSGGLSGSSIIDAVKEASKNLQQDHGKGIRRKTLSELAEAEVSSQELTSDGDYTKALEGLDKLGRSAQEWPEGMQSRLATARQQVIAAAEKELSDIEALIDSDAREATSRLSKIRMKLRGTGLEDQAKELALLLKG